MKKRNKLSWSWNGENFEVGELITEPPSEFLHRDYLNRPIVFYRGKVYILAKRKYNGRCGLVSIFQDFAIWAKDENIFQVLKVDKNDNIQRKYLSTTQIGG